MKNDKFGDRVKAALLAKTGEGTATRLAEECAKVGRKVSRTTAQRWLDMEEPMLAGKHLPVLKRALGVRVNWMLEGEPPVRPGAWRGPGGQRAAAILGELTERQRERWLAIGERMLPK